MILNKLESTAFFTFAVFLVAQDFLLFFLMSLNIKKAEEKNYQRIIPPSKCNITLEEKMLNEVNKFTYPGTVKHLLKNV